MGTVWEAHDTVLDRPVAVKEVILPPGVGDEQRAVLIERATREARTAARISHRGIIAIYDAVRHDGRPWIVMELVPSRSLDQIITEDGPLPAARVAAVGREVLSALSCAHAAGVIHRDVKPANILIGRDGRIVLTDFGIATFEEDTSLTRTGMVTGSPSFIAPERVSGAQAGPASDLWSLGATLYALATGRAPFHRTSGMAVLAALVGNEQADLAPVPPALRPALAGLLVKDPVHRVGPAEADRLLAEAASGTAAGAPMPGVPMPGGPMSGGTMPGGTMHGAPVAGGATAPAHDRPWQDPVRHVQNHPNHNHHNPNHPSHRNSSHAAHNGDNRSHPGHPFGHAPRSHEAGTPTLGGRPGHGSEMRPGRMAMLVVALVLLVTAAVAAGGWVLLREEGTGTAAGRPSTSKPGQTRTLTLQGFSSDRGWTIRAPKTWKNDHDEYGVQWWSDPKGRAVLNVRFDDSGTDPASYLAKMELALKANAANKYKRLRKSPAGAGTQAELEFTAYRATPSAEAAEVAGDYREVVRVVSTGSSFCYLHWQVRGKSWNSFQPTMRAVFKSFVAPA
ncbi:serine/threonine protein kinase [Microtetraspora sp. AC03309]|nr:serine/threonine protein kinase [Microtetraspora sp. AC03309]